VTLTPSHYLTVNVPYVHPLSEYWPQLNVSLPPEYEPKFFPCRVLSENIPQFNFGEFPLLPLETNTPVLNVLISRNPVDLNEVSMKARQSIHLYLSTDQKTFDSRYL
jgi:hypothetical protein